MLSEVLSYTSASFRLWTKFNQNEWKVACSWSSNQRIKRSTVLKGQWTVDECASSLLYGNPDGIRGCGRQQKQLFKKKKTNKKKQTWGEPSFCSGAEPGGRLQCDREVLQCVGPSMKQVLKGMLMGESVCVCVWFAIGLCNVSACFSCSSCCCGWSPCIFWSRAQANRKPPRPPAREQKHRDKKKDDQPQRW